MESDNRKMENELSQLRVAIVHDWLVGGGAEKVVLELHKMFPDAPIYTSYTTDEWRQKLDNKVVTGWLQHFGKLRKFMVLPRIWWFTHLDLSEYDLIISSSGNGEAFAVRKNYRPLLTRLKQMENGKWKMENNMKAGLHVNYCHTPTHYYWRHYEQYKSEPGFGIFNPLVRIALQLLVWPLRKWDYRAAQRADVMIANSTHIQSDIKQYYGRDSVVVFPPVNVELFQRSTVNNPPAKPRSGFLVLGRQVPQKRQILAVKACSELGLPLLVAGNGPENANLRKAAGPSVRFETNVSDSDVVQYMTSAEAFIFCGEDDFGITPVEAMAAGTPVIAYKAGGALDYVVPGKTGEFFTTQTSESLKTALERFDSRGYNSDDIKIAAQAFSIEAFHKKILNVLQDVLK